MNAPQDQVDLRENINKSVDRGVLPSVKLGLTTVQEKGFSGHNAYSASKLANLMYSVELAPIMTPKGVTVNCVHPGVVATNVLREGWGGGGISAKAMMLKTLVNFSKQCICIAHRVRGPSTCLLIFGWQASHYCCDSLGQQGSLACQLLNLMCACHIAAVLIQHGTGWQCSMDAQCCHYTIGPALRHVLLCMQSADDVFKLAVSKELGQQTGGFFAGGGIVQMPTIARDAAARQRLWRVMTEQTGASYLHNQ